MESPTHAPTEPSGASGGPPPAIVLRRRASRRFVAGVAGGLADYYRTRPTWFRLIFATSAFVTVGVFWGVLNDPYQRFDVVGNGVAALITLGAFAAVAGYLLLWWLVPREDLPESAVQRLSRRYPSARRWPGLTLLGIGLLILLDQLGIWRGDVLLAVALIAGGVLLYRRDGSTTPVGGTNASPAATAGVPESGAPSFAMAGPAAAVDPAIARLLPPRERSALGWTTLGITLLVVGGAVIWVTAGRGAPPRLVTIPSLALLVLAAGLLVGTVVGRARWLILPALLLVPLVLASSAIRLPLQGRFGDLNVYPDGPSQLNGSYRSTAGRIFIDLSRFQGLHDELQLQASSVLGDVQIVVPYDAHVVASGYAGYGTVSLLDRSDTGVEIFEQTSAEPRFGDGITIRLDLETGFGNVAVYRQAATRKQLRQLRRQSHEVQSTTRGATP